MKKRKLNYRFHNPNPADASAGYILKILMETNSEKVQLAIREAANAAHETEEKSGEGYPA